METISNNKNSSEEENNVEDSLGFVEGDGNIAPVPLLSDDVPVKKTNSWFAVRMTFYICAALFVASPLSAIFSRIWPGVFADDVGRDDTYLYLWFIAVGVSLLSFVILFFAGIYQGIRGKSFSLVGYAIVFLVILSLIGFGTCWMIAMPK